MSQIQSGASADLLTVGVTNKAARVELYDALGAPIHQALDNSFSVKIEVVPTTLTDGTPYYSLFNTGSKDMLITDIDMCLGFSGTAAATRSLLEWIRISAAAPTGGTAAAATRKDNSKVTPSGVDARYAPEGLTVAGVSLESDGFDVVGTSNQVSLSVTANRKYDEPLVLEPNQGIMLRALEAVRLGAYLIGSIQWNERA